MMLRAASSLVGLVRGAPRSLLPETRPEADLREVIGSIAESASNVGREAAEVRGLIDDTARASESGARAVASLHEQAVRITQAQTEIDTVSADGLRAVDRVRLAVEGVGREVGDVVSTLREVSDAAARITKISLQTRLVAFNATVEASRAGPSGRGFAVVAQAVKDLAAQVEQSSSDILRTIGLLDKRIEALARGIRVDDGLQERGEFHKALAEVQGCVGSIIGAAGHSREICAGLGRQMDDISAGMKSTGVALAAAMKRSETFLDVSESLIELVAESGIQTEDTPYIGAVVEAAGAIGRLLEGEVAAGRATLADLFDEAYRPIAGTAPLQHLTRFVPLADRLFPAVQEEVLGRMPKAVFCIAVDRNGFVPTHNLKYNQPQRGDLAWDSANSRYRRIFNDRTGLASARNQRSFLLQTYRRDMGGNRFVVMKEVAAPIWVGGRHWGGLRLAFQF